MLIRRDLRTTHRLKRPVARGRLVDVTQLGVARARIKGSTANPVVQISNLTACQSLSGIFVRHFEIRIAMRHRLQQQAGRRISRHDGRARLSATFPAGLQVQTESSRCFIGAMTVDAVLHQHGPDSFLKECQPFGIVLRMNSRAVLQQDHQAGGQDSDTLACHSCHNSCSTG